MTATADGIEFGPNSRDKRYVSLYRHRGSGSFVHKSCWLASVKPPEEYGIFCTADEADWVDTSGSYWGFKGSNAAALGTLGQRLAKFPRVSNEADPWHGYPTDLLGSELGGPDDFVISKMAEGGQLSYAIKAKMLRRRL